MQNEETKILTEIIDAPPRPSNPSICASSKYDFQHLGKVFDETNDDMYGTLQH